MHAAASTASSMSPPPPALTYCRALFHLDETELTGQAMPCQTPICKDLVGRRSVSTSHTRAKSQMHSMLPPFDQLAPRPNPRCRVPYRIARQVTTGKPASIGRLCLGLVGGSHKQYGEFHVGPPLLLFDLGSSSTPRLMIASSYQLWRSDPLNLAERHSHAHFPPTDRRLSLSSPLCPAAPWPGYRNLSPSYLGICGGDDGGNWTG